jgi:hypothetical protein
MKNIVKLFNNFLKNTIFKVENKTNNKFIISSFNKFLIIFISALFLYIFYLWIPLLYDKDWVKDNIASKLVSEFKINIDSFNDISYHILPKPYYLVKDSKLISDKFENQESMANFFNKDKMTIKNVVIEEANFNILRGNLRLLNDSSNNQFSNKKIIINNSNIFFKDNLEETISIIKINKATLFFDEKKLFNLFKLKGNIFTIPFNFELKNKKDLIRKKEINFEAKSLNLDIHNESFEEKNTSAKGINVISFLNSTINTEYEVKDNSIEFNSNNSAVNSSQANYNGKLSINPFDLDLNINLSNYKISRLFNFNPILIESLKSELLFNENISLNTSLIINSNTNEEIFHNAQIHFNILNGKVNLDSSKFVNEDIGLLELSNSNLFFENNKLILNTDILIDIKNSNALFSFLNTSKKSRKEIRNILINLNYDFLSNEIEFNNVKIDNIEVSTQFFNIIEGFKDNNLNNLVKTKVLLNELLSIYEG